MQQQSEVRPSFSRGGLLIGVSSRRAIRSFCLCFRARACGAILGSMLGETAPVTTLCQEGGGFVSDVSHMSTVLVDAPVAGVVVFFPGFFGGFCASVGALDDLNIFKDSDPFIFGFFIFGIWSVRTTELLSILLLCLLLF